MTHETTVGCVEFRDLITEYLEKALSPAVTLGVERHRQDCESCEEFLSQIHLTIEVLETMNGQRASEPLSQSLLNAFREWKESTERETSKTSEELLQDLLSQPEVAQRALLATTELYQSADLGQLAMQEAARMGVEAPDSALSLAELAVAILESLPSSAHQNRHRNKDKLAQALAVLGNCQKICSDFQGAAESFVRAEEALALGTGDVRHRARLLQIRSQYLADRGQLQEALKDLEDALSIYRGANERHNEGRTLIGKGRALGCSGYVEEAIPCIRRGLELIDERRDLRLVLVAKHNLVEYLSNCGFHVEAHDLLTETRELHARLSNRVDLIRFKWLEGKVARDLERMGTAEELLLQAKRYFVEQEIAYDAALVSLDLAMVYLKQARIVELKELAGEMVTIFSGLGVQRELFAAMAFFNKAKEIEQSATMGLLQELIEILDKARQRVAYQPQPGVSN